MKFFYFVALDFYIYREPALPATFPLVPTLHTAVWVEESDTVTANGCTYTKDMKTLLTAQKDITNATIPDSMTEIGFSAFNECSNLTSVTFKDTAGWYYSWKGIEIDVTDPAQNAIYLKETYTGNSWYKKESSDVSD